MFNRVSADGYFGTESGQLDWLVPDSELDQAGARATPGSDLMLFGRRTYDAFESFWPHAGDEDPHAAGRHSPTMKAFAGWINQTKKLVFSRTKKSVTWQNSELVSELDPTKLVELKQGPGKQIMIFGSGELVSALTEHRLIDEYQFVVTPKLLGSGKTLIQGVSRHLPLALEEAKAYPSGNVMLRYRRAD